MCENLPVLYANLRDSGQFLPGRWRFCKAYCRLCKACTGGRKAAAVRAKRARISPRPAGHIPLNPLNTDGAPSPFAGPADCRSGKKAVRAKVGRGGLNPQSLPAPIAPCPAFLVPLSQLPCPSLPCSRCPAGGAWQGAHRAVRTFLQVRRHSHSGCPHVQKQGDKGRMTCCRTGHCAGCLRDARAGKAPRTGLRTAGIFPAATRVLGQRGDVAQNLGEGICRQCAFSVHGSLTDPASGALSGDIWGHCILCRPCPQTPSCCNGGRRLHRAGSWCDSRFRLP